MAKLKKIFMCHLNEKWSKYLFEYDKIDYVRFNEIKDELQQT
jgi:hypothetical protein